MHFTRKLLVNSLGMEVELVILSLRCILSIVLFSHHLILHLTCCAYFLCQEMVVIRPPNRALVSSLPLLTYQEGLLPREEAGYALFSVSVYYWPFVVFLLEATLKILKVE
jgi:hypothetical protein